MIQTNEGPKTPQEVLDRCMFGSYAAQRDRGVSADRLRALSFYDVDRYEPMYRSARGAA